MTTLASTPPDLHLMRGLMRACWISCVVVLIAIGGLLLARLPIFNVQSIAIQGEFHRLNHAAIAQAALKSINGTTLTTDLPALHNAVASHAWARQVSVHRHFPNQLRIEIYEHIPVAIWGKTDDENIKMLNNFGEIFEANSSDIDTDIMVQLIGPDNDAVQVLSMYHDLAPVFQSAQQEIASLQLTSRGTWSSKTTHGATIELGAGEGPQLRDRLTQFFVTLPKICEKLGTNPTHLESADLRHQSGYALKLRGVTTESKTTETLALLSQPN